MIKERTTKFTTAVRAFMQRAGHATNQQILVHLQQQFPELSATTVHRITSRMVERGELTVAPNTKDSSTRYDINIRAHDHFQCANCDRLRDIELPQNMFDSIQQLMGDCKLDGRLTVRGSCNKCLQHAEEQ